MIGKCGISSIVLLILLSGLADSQNLNLNPKFEWNYLDFAFPSDTVRNAAIANGEFIPGNSYPLDIDVHNGDNGSRYFVTIPRIIPGTPVTVGTVSNTNEGNGPIITPYPNYDWQNAPNCTGFTSVYRVFVDKCDRLWVMDTGKVLGQQVCLPQLVVFDLKTDTPEFTYKFPSNLVRDTSLFPTPIVDVRCSCADTMVYIADSTGYGVIVFDLKNQQSWRVESDLFHPVESNSTFTIDGVTFQIMDGVYGLSVSPKNFRNRQLYFHPMASVTEYAIPLSILDNVNLWQQPTNNANAFVQIGIRDNTQSTVEAMDRNGNQFFATFNPLGIASWDSTRPYTKRNMKLVAQNDETLQFISGLKIVTKKNDKQELLVMSNRLQRLFAGGLNLTEVNFRVQGQLVSNSLEQNHHNFRH